MIKKYLLLSVLCFSTTSALACELPSGEAIKIGCTYDCSFLYRFRIIMTAWGMGYKTRFTSLNHAPDMMSAMKDVDAILIPGGADIDPKYYLNSITPELQSYTKDNLKLVKFSQEGEERDPFEYSVVQTYSKDESFKNVPMLGICRGLQMMSVAQGIPLYLDIKTELGIKNRYNRFDRVNVETSEESLMNSLYSRDSFRGFKLHHQGIRVSYYEDHQDDYPMTKVTAFSNNRKIAEAIEYTHRPALGVQYHPEKSFSGTSVPVFRWFLTKACEYKNSSRKE